MAGELDFFLEFIMILMKLHIVFDYAIKHVKLQNSPAKFAPELE